MVATADGPPGIMFFLTQWGQRNVSEKCWDNRHTGLYIADELKAVINDLGPQKVFALVTDNAANMKAAWSEVGVLPSPHTHWLSCSCIESALQGHHGTETMENLQESQGNG